MFEIIFYRCYDGINVRFLSWWYCFGESNVHVIGWNIFGCKCVLSYIWCWYLAIGEDWNTLAPSVTFLLNNRSLFFWISFCDDVISRNLKEVSLVRTFISVFVFSRWWYDMKQNISCRVDIGCKSSLKFQVIKYNIHLLNSRLPTLIW